MVYDRAQDGPSDMRVPLPVSAPTGSVSVVELVLDRPPGLTVEEAASEGRRALMARRRLLTLVDGEAMGFAPFTMPRYQAARHLLMLAAELESVERGECLFLVVEEPPRHGKTELVSVRFPAWYIGRRPDRNFINCSYGDTLATRNGRKVRNILGWQRVREIFPDAALAQDSKAANLWTTEAGGEFLSVGIGGGITGHGAHILNIDDPIKSREEAESHVYRDKIWHWFTAEAFPRLEPDGAIILTLTRWHEDDLAGRILEKLEEVADLIGRRPRVVRLPALAEAGDLLGRERGEALWPERFTTERLAAIRAIIGSRDWAALYQQRPSPEEGDIFKWWPQYKSLPEPHAGVLIGIDTAYSEQRGADATAAASWVVGPDRKLRLANAVSWVAEAPMAERGLRWFYEETKARFPNVPIRPLVRKKVAIDRIMAQHLRVAGVPAIAVDMPGGDKEVYARMVVPEFEGERALIPEYAPWLDAWQQQHLNFPNAPHDDYVETTNVVLYYHTRNPTWKRPSDTDIWGEL
ncbi:hypothetical protein LCGC14_1734800 [marine sediment metagenome]|uniref:Uncharacterized protein n=1 Tax=marine sediment metagenome TaxID=412755 RepID=A0A0F9H8H4_9ZZZZ